MAKNLKPYVFTPKRRVALSRAQAKSAMMKRLRARIRNSKTGGKKPSKGFKAGGVGHLRTNFTPYARVNQRSLTIGANTGAGIPFSNRRVSMGSFFRIENKDRSKPLNEAISRTADRYVKPGSGAAKVRKFFGDNVRIDSPVVRGKFGSVEARATTSRGGGPTLVVRRGKHKTPLHQTKAGVVEYDRRMRVLFDKRKRKQYRPRAERRGKK